jgi:predicted amidohydrolase YtcJ
MKFAPNMPDLLLVNGNIRTQNPIQPKAQAVLISGGFITAVGDDSVRRLANSGATVIDLEGKTVLPGMTDAHFHFFDWAMARRNLMLAHVRSLEELTASVLSAAGEKPRGTWIIGQGWNEADWDNPQMPTRTNLDRAAPHHPVILWRCDMHMAVANTPALALAGIDQHTSDQITGRIERDSSGFPNGILKEKAVDLVKAVIPRAAESEILTAMSDGITALHELGLTGIHDVRIMGGEEGGIAFRTWQRLRERGELPLRCWVTLPGERLDEAIALGLRTGFGDDCLRIGHVKFFADGGMGARTAWMTAPYQDAECGMPLTPPEELAIAIQKAENAGLAVMVHAIGDLANREVIGIFEQLKLAPNFSPASQHRIEHVQMIQPEDVKRLSALKYVAACVQPHNMILDMNMVDASVGKRGRRCYAFKDLINAGIPTLLSSDAPVCDPSPLIGIHAALTRRRRDATPSTGWYPEQRLTLKEAIYGYTVMPARVHGIENELGSISPGKRADMIVLDRDIYAIDPMKIVETSVVMTIFDGRIVMDRR